MGVWAQSHSFTVLASKGENEVMKGTKWVPVKAGTKIYKGNKVKVAVQGYLGMLHKSGKTVEIKNQGEYTIAQLETSLQSKSTSFSEKYAQFVLNDFNELSEEDKEYSVVASVERAPNEPLFLGPDTLLVIKDIPLTLPWETKKEIENSELHINDLADQVLTTLDASKSAAVLDLSKTKLEAGQMYFTKVYDTESKKYATDTKVKKVILVDETVSKDVLKEYKELLKELDLKKSTNHLILAGFFLDKSLKAYAASHYYQAMTLSPEIKGYQKLYENYLKNIGVLEEVK
jgi:hypothetical protein